MGKNNKLIDACNRMLSDKINQIVPCAFCSFIVVLSEEYGWSHEELEELLMKVQDKYEEVEKMGSVQMNDYCEQVTGIMLLPSKEK